MRSREAMRWADPAIVATSEHAGGEIQHLFSTVHSYKTAQRSSARCSMVCQDRGGEKLRSWAQARRVPAEKWKQKGAQRRTGAREKQSYKGQEQEQSIGAQDEGKFPPRKTHTRGRYRGKGQSGSHGRRATGGMPVAMARQAVLERWRLAAKARLAAWQAHI